VEDTGLTRTVRPDQGRDLTLPQAERDVGQRREPTEVEGDVVETQEVRHGGEVREEAVTASSPTPAGCGWLVRGAVSWPPRGSVRQPVRDGPESLWSDLEQHHRVVAPVAVGEADRVIEAVIEAIDAPQRSDQAVARQVGTGGRER